MIVIEQDVLHLRMIVLGLELELLMERPDDPCAAGRRELQLPRRCRLRSCRRRRNAGVVHIQPRAEADRYRTAFFRAYPGLARWHRSTPDAPVDTRTLTGRRRLGVNRFTEKLNTPVQGTGADGIKLALALLGERREQLPGAFPVLAVHDEIVLECPADQADAAAAVLKTAMIDAMAPIIDPVPVEVEVTTAPSWGG